MKYRLSQQNLDADAISRQTGQIALLKDWHSTHQGGMWGPSKSLCCTISACNGFFLNHLGIVLHIIIITTYFPPTKKKRKRKTNKQTNIMMTWDPTTVKDTVLLIVPC